MPKRKKRKVNPARLTLVLILFIIVLILAIFCIKLIFVDGLFSHRDPITESTQDPSVNSTAEPTVEPTEVPSLDHTSVDSIYLIVNKQHDLPADYEPDDLVVPEVKSLKKVMMRKEAAEALEAMFEAAKADGITLIAGSGYRSYDYQKTLYNNYVARDGQQAADRYSAKPGKSEHQTGLAMDISDSQQACYLKTCFQDTEEGKWLKEHCAEYGFVLRFLDGKEDVTGYMFEPWHFRYIGKEEAAKIMESGLTLEEFYNYTD